MLYRRKIVALSCPEIETATGMAASPQTGWTGLITWLMTSFVALDLKEVLQAGSMRSI